MNFAESTQYLFSLGNEVSAMKLGLENIRKLLEALGNPQNNYLKVQVAGTNGKGSVCAFLDSICTAAGIHAGTFTSPHLISITERIRINGNYISEEDFATHATRVRDVAEQLLATGDLEYRPTFFEQITAIALVAFAYAGIEVAILETGLGGRLDATTAANAEIAVITQIDIDHQEYLGETIKEIAAEKAAIIHSGSKTLIASQTKEVEIVIAGHCREVGVDPSFIETNVKLTPQTIDYSENAVFNTGQIQIQTRKHVYQEVDLGLWGKHQWMNATLAIEIAELLTTLGFEITRDQCREGLRVAKHSGRLELVNAFLLDGAHNVAGARALAEYLKEFIHQPITLVFGSMRDKDIEGITSLLFPSASTIILTKPNNPRSLMPSALLKYLPVEFRKDDVVVTESVEEALRVAPYRTLRGISVVTGSLYLVGEVKKILKSQI